MLTLVLYFPRHLMDAGLFVYRQVFPFLRYIGRYVCTYTHTLLTHIYKILYRKMPSMYVYIYASMYTVMRTHTKEIKSIYIFEEYLMD